MTQIQLSDTQAVILSAACARDDRIVFPVTTTLKGGAINAVLGSLLKKGLVEEIPAMSEATVWRHGDDDTPLTLRATPAACATLGIESDVAPAGADGAPEEEPAADMAEAVETGEVPLSRLDESVRRILEFKTAQGLFNTSGAPLAEAAPVTVHAGARDFAKTVAARCLTLVRNRRDVLPLNANKIQTVLILYASARPSTALSRVAPFVKKLEARGIAVRVHVNGNCLDIVKMEESGERFDAFLCLVDQHMHDLKNTMRPTGEMGECLWTVQNTETLDPVIISLGSPYLLNDMPYADTLVNAYSSDPFVMEALDQALFGEAGFPGKSPVETGGDWVSQKICALPPGAVTTGGTSFC